MRMKHCLRILSLLFCLPLLFACGGEGEESTPTGAEAFVMTARIKHRILLNFCFKVVSLLSWSAKKKTPQAN